MKGAQTRLIIGNNPERCRSHGIYSPDQSALLCKYIDDKAGS